MKVKIDNELFTDTAPENKGVAVYEFTQDGEVVRVKGTGQYTFAMLLACHEAMRQQIEEMAVQIQKSSAMMAAVESFKTAPVKTIN